MDALTALRAELENALADMKRNHAPIIYVAGYTAGLRHAIQVIEKSKEN